MTAPATDRGVRVLADPLADMTSRERWAVVIGISEYKDERLRLRFAHRDAEAFCRFLQSPAGGGLADSHLKKLIDENASLGNIQRALRTFLKKPGREDVVILFFACHGAPDPELPQNIYLLPWDTDPDDISGTALLMRTVEDALSDTLRAERVVMFVDTCHSAAIADGGRRAAPDGNAAVNQFLKQLSEAKRGRAVLTSSESGETAKEGEEWGQEGDKGHGVFTHFLLKGLAGDADQQPRDGWVRIGELFEYVRDQVEQATGHRQHPFIGHGAYDRNMVMARTGGRPALEGYQLGQHLYRLALLQDERRRFAAAAAQVRVALMDARKAGMPLPDAALVLGKALLAAGDIEGAIRELQRAADADREGTPGETWLQLGMAHARAGSFPAAAEALSRFLSECPDDGNAAWVASYLTSIKGRQKGESKYALLIGVTELGGHPQNLAGPPNDIALVKSLLLQRGFPEAEISILIESSATRQDILDGLDALAARTTPLDSIIVYYSGWGFQPNGNLSMLVAGGSRIEEGQVKDGIAARELHDLMERLPATDKSLIMDANLSTQMVELARRGSYRFLGAATPSEHANESREDDGGQSVAYGAFTRELAKVVARVPDGQLIDESGFLSVLSAVHDRFPNQTPLLAGPDFAIRHLFETSRFFEFSHRRSYASWSAAALKEIGRILGQPGAAPHPRAWHSLGRAFLENGDYVEARTALKSASQQSKLTDPEIDLALGVAQMGSAQYAEALASLRSYLASLPPESPQAVKMQEPLALLSGLGPERRRALLVGINRYLSPEIPPLAGAVNDVLAVKAVLVERYGLKEEHITVLLDEQATCSAILQGFRDLAEASRQEPALFYFAGHGSVDTEGIPTLVGADSRQEGGRDIRLTELAELVGSIPTNLATMIDAGLSDIRLVDYWQDDRAARRVIRRDERTTPGTRDIRVPSLQRDLNAPYLRIGRVSVYHALTRLARAGNDQTVKLKAEFQAGGQAHGELTWALVQSLREADPDQVTFSRLAERAAQKIASHEIVILGDRISSQVLGNMVMQEKAQQLWTRTLHESIREMVLLLANLVRERNEEYPDGYLHLGIAHAVLGEHDQSIRALQMWLSHQSKASAPEEQLAEGHYYLGRAYFESRRDLNGAVSELRQAVANAPDLAQAQYFLGQSLRALIETQILVDAEKALRAYLAGGAPLGHQEEVQQFLGTLPSRTDR